VPHPEREGTDLGAGGAMSGNREKLRMCRQHALVSLELSDALIRHADSFREDCQHDDCLLLDGVMRDSALRIRRLSESLIRVLDKEGAGEASIAI